jgi:uncharacterized membrane protein YgcG
MKPAYKTTGLYNLAVIKETKRWFNQGLIEADQFEKIKNAYKSSFYHPNLTVRILLFVASLLALAGVTGLFFLFVSGVDKDGIAIACIFYGLISFVFLELVFIRNDHYKSGVNEAILYHACAFVISGFGAWSKDYMSVYLWISLITFSWTAFRYLDLITTLGAVISLAGVLFNELYFMGGIFKNIIPFAFIIFFTPVYLYSRALRKKIILRMWRNNLLIVEAGSLLLIYLGGNYLVVRELSISMMDLELQPGQDIPFAMIFYALTIAIPLLYLWNGIVRKDVVLLRVSLVVLAFSVFTFKFYYSLGHHEITLTVAGAVLLTIAILLTNYLKKMRKGFTRDNLLEEKWGNMHLEAFVISQTMGGNQAVTDQEFKGGGGSFGGGGASGGY